MIIRLFCFILIIRINFSSRKLIDRQEVKKKIKGKAKTNFKRAVNMKRNNGGSK